MYIAQANELVRAGRSNRAWNNLGITIGLVAPVTPRIRGVAVWAIKLYFTTSDAHLLALQVSTGNLMWDERLTDPKEGYSASGVPRRSTGRSWSASRAETTGWDGLIDADDAGNGPTGSGVFHAIPSGGEPGSETWAGDSWKHGGGATWLTGSYDRRTNLIYRGNPHPGPDFNGDTRKGDNLYTDCLVVLDADTGKLKWYFQFTPHDTMDWDAVEIPVLIDATFKGVRRTLLAQANRNGFFYLLDRTSGKFLTGRALRASDELGQRSHGRWPAGSGFGQGACPAGVPVCPATSGATNWMSPAYSPETGLFYVVAQEGCAIETKSAEPFRPGGLPYRDGSYVESPEEPWRMHVRALDLATGKVQWDFEQVGSRHYGAGLLSTGGGLLFAGDDHGNLTAHDARTGKPLWHFYTGQSITSSPMTYSLRDRQYIALTAGSDVIAFGLYE